MENTFCREWVHGKYQLEPLGLVVAAGRLLSQLVKEDNDFHAILVIDECGPTARSDLSSKLKRRGPRVKLVSIDNEFERIGGNTSVVEARPLANDQIAEIL